MSCKDIFFFKFLNIGAYYRRYIHQGFIVWFFGISKNCTLSRDSQNKIFFNYIYYKCNKIKLMHYFFILIKFTAFFNNNNEIPIVGLWLVMDRFTIKLLMIKNYVLKSFASNIYITIYIDNTL